MKRFLASTLLAFLPLLPAAGHATTVSSITTSCPASGPAVGVVTLAGGLAVQSKSGNYTAVATDCGSALSFSAAATLTLPAPVTGFTIPNIANPAAPLTLAPTGGVLVDGKVSETFAPGTNKSLYTDGANYFTTGGGTSQFSPGYTVGPWYIPANYGAINGSGQSMAINSAYCTPAWINDVSAQGGGTGTIGSLAARIMTVGTTNLQLAIYANDATATPYRPGALLNHTASIPNTTAGAVSAALLAGVNVGPGLVWMCAEANDNSVRIEALPFSSTASSFFASAVGSTNVGNVLSSNALDAVFTVIGTFGTWPSTMHGNTFVETGFGPVLAFTFSSIP